MMAQKYSFLLLYAIMGGVFFYLAAGERAAAQLTGFFLASFHLNYYICDLKDK